jgi:hypothetical protein
MSTQAFALIPGGPDQLRLVRISGDEYGIELDGVRLRSFARVPKIDQQLALPDGRQLVVRWKPGFGGVGAGWDILDGKTPLPGSVNDPVRLVKDAGAAFLVIAAMTGIAALLALAGVGFIRTLGISPWQLIDAALFAGIGALVLRRVAWALYLGIALFVAGTLLTCSHALANSSSSGSAGLTGSLFVRVALFLAMARAVPVISKRP